MIQHLMVAPLGCTACVGLQQLDFGFGSSGFPAQEVASTMPTNNHRTGWAAPAVRVLMRILPLVVGIVFGWQLSMGQGADGPAVPEVALALRGHTEMVYAVAYSP